MTELSRNEKIRYSRHLILPEVGEDGQKKLKNARIAIIGLGGLGSPVSLYLAAAGVGHLGIFDCDEVDLTNLQRQVLYTVEDVGKQKSESAAQKLSALNPEIDVISHKVRLNASNVLEAIENYDIVVDGTDNFSTRYLINDACVLLHKPNVYGSIFRFEGQLSVFCTPEGPCYRCLFPQPPEGGAVPNCAEGGVFGVLAGAIGTLQATEAVKLVLGEGTPLIGKLLIYNALDMEFHKLNVKRKESCPACGEQTTITKPTDYDTLCATPPAVNTMTELEAKEVAQILKERGEEVVLLDVRNHNEVALCKIDGSIHIPLMEIPHRYNELDKNAEMIVYCRSGVRSRNAIEFLSQAGFKNMRNLKGGILAWANQIDPSMPTY